MAYIICAVVGGLLTVGAATLSVTALYLKWKDDKRSADQRATEAENKHREVMSLVDRMYTDLVNTKARADQATIVAKSLESRAEQSQKASAPASLSDLIDRVMQEAPKEMRERGRRLEDLRAQETRGVKFATEVDAKLAPKIDTVLREMKAAIEQTSKRGLIELKEITISPPARTVFTLIELETRQRDFEIGKVVFGGGKTWHIRIELGATSSPIELRKNDHAYVGQALPEGWLSPPRIMITEIDSGAGLLVNITFDKTTFAADIGSGHKRIIDRIAELKGKFSDVQLVAAIIPDLMLMTKLR